MKETDMDIVIVVSFQFLYSWPLTSYYVSYWADIYIQII